MCNCKCQIVNDVNDSVKFSDVFTNLGLSIIGVKMFGLFGKITYMSWSSDIISKKWWVDQTNKLQ